MRSAFFVAGAGLALWGASWAAEEAEPAALRLPLKGVMAECCDQAIAKELAALKVVRSAAVRAEGETEVHVAEIILKDGEGLALTDLRKALAAANKAMGDAMGTKYELDGELSSAVAHFYRTASAPDAAALRQALAGLKGYEGAWIKKSGFAVRYGGAAPPSVDKVIKAAGLEVTEVILAPAVAGKRHACPMHPEKVAASARAKCPSCGMALVEVPIKP